MTSVPRWTESVLHGLGADVGFGEELIGDLAEEFAALASTRGVVHARRWYYRESMRAIPHLVRNWRYHASHRDVRDLAGVSFASLMFVMTIGVVLRMAVHGRVMFGVVPASLLEPTAAWSVVGVLLAFVTAVIGGYVAAWMYSRAPVVAAVSFGAVWSCLAIAGLLFAPDASLGKQVFAIPVALIIATAGGGILRACRMSRVCNS